MENKNSLKQVKFPSDVSILESGILLGFIGDRPSEAILGPPEGISESLFEADSQLVAAAYKLASGYQTEDESIEYENVPKYNEVNGQRIDRWIPIKKTVTKKNYKPDNSALKMLLQARCSKDFQQVSLKLRKNINKPDSVEGQVISSASRLLEEMRQKKTIKSKTVETKE